MYTENMHTHYPQGSPILARAAQTADGDLKCEPSVFSTCAYPGSGCDPVGSTRKRDRVWSVLSKLNWTSRSEEVSEQRITSCLHREYRYVLGTNISRKQEVFCTGDVQGLMKMSGALVRSAFAVDMSGELCTVPDFISTDHSTKCTFP
jgi:hypothetical protein